ncbi:MAG: hypothetical protein NVSMB32_07340 [Actinomycetota bacterium]
MIALPRARARLSPPACRPGAQGGFVTLELVLGLAVLVVPIGLLVLVLPTWFARQNFARLAAQQAARRAVISQSLDQGYAAARAVATDAGLDPTKDLTVHYGAGSSLARGGTVTAQARVRMPALVIPGLGDVGSFSWTASYSEAVDQYRSGP